METRASHKNDCKRPALKEKLVTEEGDLLGLAPPVDTAVSADEVETEEVEEPFFPTIGARVMGLEKQDGGQNGDDNDDEPQLQETLNEADEGVIYKCINPRDNALHQESSYDSETDSLSSVNSLQRARANSLENEFAYLFRERSIEKDLLALQEKLRLLRYAKRLNLKLETSQSYTSQEYRSRVHALMLETNALRHHEVFQNQDVGDKILSQLDVMSRKISYIETCVEQMQLVLAQLALQPVKVVKAGSTDRRSKAILCWACHQESHKMAQCPGIIRPKTPVAKEGRTFCIKCNLWYGGKVCYCRAM